MKERLFTQAQLFLILISALALGFTFGVLTGVIIGL